MDTWQAIDKIRDDPEVHGAPARARASRPHPQRRPSRRQLQEHRSCGTSSSAPTALTWSQLAEVGPYAAHLAGAAAAVALVVPDPATHEAPYSIMWDLGRAAQNMVLAAWELGIGSVPATVYRQDLARELLGYPADRWCEFLLSFGYPENPEALTWPKRAGGRKPLEAIVHYERW